MGATPFPGGVTFRVWAPFARSVAAAGTFNAWSAQDAPLASEGNGYWSADDTRAHAGDEYKLVIADASGNVLWKNDPYARSMTNEAGNGVIETPSVDLAVPGYSTPPWNELVIYELHVGTFSSDPATPSGHGTFRSLVAKLDALADLGVNAIEVMASGEFGTDISWGYNPDYVFAIEHAYGGPDAFRVFVREAHRRGIAVIFDVVYNHFGTSDLDMWRFDGWSENDGGGIYFYEDWRRATPWGDTRPDYGRGEVRQYLRDNALYWLEQLTCDGLRWDATSFVRNAYGRNDDPGSDIPDGWSLMQWIHREIAARQPWKISIAEDMQSSDWVTRDVGAGGAGFGAQWDAASLHALRGVLAAAVDGDRSMQAVADAIRRGFSGRSDARVLYLESHDEVTSSSDPGKARLPVACDPSSPTGWFARKRAALGSALVLTAPAIPMLFQGQEFLDEDPFDDQVLLDWSKRDRRAGLVALHRDLVRLRRNWFDTTRGLKGHANNVFHVNDAGKVLAFHRWDAGGPRDDVVVLLNFADRAYESYRIGLPRGGLWRVRFNGDARAYADDFGDHPGFDTSTDGAGADSMPFAANVGIGPYAALVLSQDD
jgi:1,4-alpha-glucan branching enzyme